MWLLIPDFGENAHRYGRFPLNLQPTNPFCYGMVLKRCEVMSYENVHFGPGRVFHPACIV